MVFSNVLGRLGGSAEAVADSLRASGIQGVRNTVRFLNPVVRYLLSRRLVAYADFDLSARDRVRFLSPTSGLVREVPLPLPVQQFLDAFDQGHYPDLELPLTQP